MRLRGTLDVEKYRDQAVRQKGVPRPVRSLTHFLFIQFNRSQHMPHQAIRRIALAIALAVLPGMAGVVSAAGSQAGDNGRQPIGADNDTPRQAIPNATTNDANVNYSYGYRQEMVEGHPPYLTYYYTSPPVTDEYSPAWRGYYRYAYPGDTSGRNTNTSPRCEPLTGAAYVDCLHGAAPGGN